MSDANAVTITYLTESSFGLKAETGAPKTLRFVSESLAQNNNVVTSNEVRDDGQRSDLKRTDVTAGGQINGELSYATYDDFIARALRKTAAGWSSAVTATVTGTAVATGTKITAASGLNVFLPNQWVKVSGFSVALNNGFYKVVSATSTTLTLSGGTLTNEAGVAGVKIVMGAQVVNGTSIESFSLQRAYNDVEAGLGVQEAADYYGCVIDGMTVNAVLKQITSISFNIMASVEKSVATDEPLGDTTALAPTTSSPMASTDEIIAVLENLSKVCAQNVNFAVTNNLRPRNCLGTMGPTSYGLGTIDVTGSLQSYFTSRALMDKFLNQTRSSFAFIVSDASGSYVFDFPAIKYTSGQRVAGGINTDIIADMRWTAFMHPTELVTLRIAKFEP